MTIETFTREQFEAALPTKDDKPLWESLGLVSGECVYIVPVTGTNKRIVIRSSVKGNGVSASTGQDSIRLWVEYQYKNKWFALAKLDAWTTRVPGWQERMTKKLRELYALALEDSKMHRNTSGANDGGNGKQKENTPSPSLVPEGAQVPQGAGPACASGAVGSSSPPTPGQRLQSPTAPIFILNEFQQAIIDALAEGPQVVEACPGSGKTRTLENLVAALIKSGVAPNRIGVFTFSNSAAAEARSRIARTLWPDISENELAYLTDPHGYDGPAFDDAWLDAEPARRMLVEWTCTIHAMNFRLLKELGKKSLKVLSGKDQWDADSLIKDSLKELHWKESPRSIKAYISLAIRNLIVPAKAEAFYAEVLAGTDVAWRAGDLAEIFRRYYDLCRSRNLVDFDMMQARVVWRLRNDPAWRERAQAKFDYILVDEAQDTSPQQAEILWTLAERTDNIMFCGDVDQSQYAFRGAQPEVLRGDFEAKWPAVTRYNLPINYRSTREIVKVASRLIARNYQGPDDKYLKPFSARDDAEDGEPVTYSEHNTFAELCGDVAAMVAENPQDWFILSRTRAECAAIHTELIRRRIPAVNKSGGMLFGAPHVRKMLAYARLACDYQNARDDEEILCEIANVASVEFRAPFTTRRHREGCHNRQGWVECGCPVIMEQDVDYSHARYYGRKAIQEACGWNGILDQRWETNRGGYPTTRAKGASDLVGFVHRLEKLTDNARQTLEMIASDCVLPWLEAEYGLASDDLAENGKAEDIALLINMAQDGMTLAEFLDDVESLTQGGNAQDDSQSAILGTIHWSKGRERKAVILNTTRLPIIPPKQKPGTLPVGKPPEIEEERRLAYVGITRAMETCAVVGALEWNQQPAERSRFVMELEL
jgi:DNA helicase-2/ATP-dependent DNA helicase PcrA